MEPHKPLFAAFAAATLAVSAFAQVTFVEVEPNAQKSEATPVVGIASGDLITGTTTGVSTTLGSTLDTTADTFRVRTAPMPLGIYKHSLTLTTSTPTGHTCTIRGLNQTGVVGTASTGGTVGTADTTFQISSPSGSNIPRFNLWYGFGKQEEIYYRVAGTTATSDAYTATMVTASVPFTAIAPPFESSAPITISTIWDSLDNTDVHVFDAAFNAIPGFDNDDEGPGGPTLRSRLVRTFAPGTYYLAMGASNVSWNLPFPPDEDLAAQVLLDFPDCIARASLTNVQDWDFRISAANGVWLQPAQLPANSPFELLWYQFTVMAGAPPITATPPPNDDCSAPRDVSHTPGTVSRFETMLGATNDGTATCDPGGAFSRDVWYAFTNSEAVPRTLVVTTCDTATLPSTTDTVVSLYNACGGTQLSCSDDCGGAPCGGVKSCTPPLLVFPGQTILIRVADKGLGGVGDFTLVTTVSAPVPSNDGCATPIAIGAGTYAFDITGATTGTEGQGPTPACASTTSVKKDLWYTYTAGVTGLVAISNCGLTLSGVNNTKIAYYLGGGCPSSPSPLGCNDDGCTVQFQGETSTITFPVTCGQDYAIQLGAALAGSNIWGTFSLTESGSPCSTPASSFCAGDTPGTTCVACANNGSPGRGCANSVFATGTRLVSSGSASVSADSLVLTAIDVPGPGLFFQSNALAASPITFGDGMLCAAVGIIRMGVVFPTAGFTASYPGGLTPNPISIAGSPIGAGDVKHYQCWYRDAVAFCSSATFNTSNGVTLRWAP